MIEENKLDGCEAAYNQMKIHLDSQFKSLASLKNNANTLLGAGGIITGLVGMLKIFDPVPNDWVMLHNTAIVGVLFLFAILVCLCIFVIIPTDMFGQIRPDWETLDQSYFKKDGLELMYSQISDILSAIEKNDEILKYRVCIIRVSGIFFSLITIILLLLALIPRI